MAKNLHEIRDPIHVFISLSSDERNVLDSRPFQRLRHIQQLALTSLLYPGATHKRFEHSLGVMELAGQVFREVTREEKVTDQIRQLLPEITDRQGLSYWERAVRMAALCHDLGHLPFSHAAERELLPAGWDHERLSRAAILSPEMMDIWQRMRPPLCPDDVVKLALGKKGAPDLSFSTWEAILSEIIVGDAFGVDRIDYLLRDSYHAGVAYGRFDHHRLIQSLRVLPSTPSAEGAGTSEPVLGVAQGGLHAAEALMLARYFMYSQVYFHHVRRIYDIHLKDFLAAWLSGGRFPTDIERHLRLTDNEVSAAIWEAAVDPNKPGHDPARRIVRHRHYKLLYERNPADVSKNREAARAIFEAAKAEFGADAVRQDKYTAKSEPTVFPVLTRDGDITSSVDLSETLVKLPPIAVDFVYVLPEKWNEAKAWLASRRAAIIEPKAEETG